MYCFFFLKKYKIKDYSVGRPSLMILTDDGRFQIDEKCPGHLFIAGRLAEKRSKRAGRITSAARLRWT